MKTIIKLMFACMMLKKGSSGENVRKLQQKLGLTPDGSFGPVTELKVREWQAVQRLTGV